MTELIEKVKAAKEVLNSSQKELLNWCRDKSAATLDQRFDTWAKYVDKKEHSYINVGGGSKLLTELVEAWTDNRDFDRHQTVSWDWLIEGICDMYDSTYNRTSSKEKIQKVLDKHVQYLRDKKLDVILSDSPNVEATVPSLSNLTVNDLENILREEIMICNFGSFEYDW